MTHLNTTRNPQSKARRQHIHGRLQRPTAQYALDTLRAAFTGENLIGFLLLATAFPLIFSLVWIGSPA